MHVLESIHEDANGRSAPKAPSDAKARSHGQSLIAPRPLFVPSARPKTPQTSGIRPLSEIRLGLLSARNLAGVRPLLSAQDAPGFRSLFKPSQASLARGQTRISLSLLLFLSLTHNPRSAVPKAARRAGTDDGLLTGPADTQPRVFR